MNHPFAVSVPWSTKALGELCSGRDASIQTGPFGSQLHASDYVADGIPCVMPQDIREGRISTENIARITLEDHERLNRFHLRIGDIVYPRRGDISKRALVGERENGWLCGTGCLRIRPNLERVNPKYLAYYLSHPDVCAWIEGNAVGATMPHLNTGLAGKIQVVSPPLPEQREIAAILGALDDKIELNRKMAATLEAMARALYRSWFVDFDPVWAKTEGRPPAHMDHVTAALFPDSFGDDGLPVGWEVRPLLDIVELLSGGTPKTSVPEFWDGDIPWASAKDVSQCGQVFLVSTERKITPLGLAKSSTKMIPAHSTVVVARGATTGRACMFGEDIAMNQTCYALKSRNAEPFFANCMFMTEVLGITMAAHGSVFDTITTKTLQATSVVSPTPQLSGRFEANARPMFERILELMRENQTLATLRDTLLPRLMAGELRVGEAREQVEAVA